MRPKKVILLVDGNEQSLSVRKFLLETRGPATSSGYSVIAVETAARALEVLAEAVPGAIDLLAADLLLSGMDGNELVRRAKQVNSGLPCLLFSGTVTSFDRALAADAFLPKGGCSSVEFLEKVRVLVARKRGPKPLRGIPAAARDVEGRAA